MIYSDFMEFQDKEPVLVEMLVFEKIREEKLNSHEKELIALIRKQNSFYKTLKFKAAIVLIKNAEYRVLVDNEGHFYEI